MIKAHTPINWENEPSFNTPINETNLNKMDSTIGVLDDRIIEQETSKLDKSTAYTMVKDISFNENNGIFTVTRLNGSTFTIDTRLEKIAINFRYDYSTQKLIVTLVDGSTQSIDMSALLTQYEFEESNTISWEVSEDGKVKAKILDGSITEDMLQPNYLAEIKVESAKAEASSINAESSAESAFNSAESAQYYYEETKSLYESSDISNAASKELYGTTTINVGRKANTTVGGYSVAVGYNTTASGQYSHAEGQTTTASSVGSHAEGTSTTASGYASHAEGSGTTASGYASHAEGSSTTALAYQHAQGHYNDTSLAKANSSSGTSTGTAFVIGNGTNSTKSNAFRVQGDGKVYAKAAYNSTGADYAEFAEWADGNPENEDRRGYFVTFDEEKPNMIRKANEGEYILGIVSGNPCVIGNSDEGWLGKYEFDEFGAIIYEETEQEVEYTDEETGEIKIKLETITTYKLNPNYDDNREYIHRSERQEWDYVGWIGVLSVRDDGTCIPGGYCKPTDGGMATAAERSIDTYRVLERVNNNIVKVALK